MASQLEDASPLVAALPPETDYMTYLTLLEYQLTSSNLPILTKLLSDDDGALAAGIGWDLLKLVLPFSKEVPEETGECLEVVARRGNPKEVVVQVTVELESLGQEEHDGESSGDDQVLESDRSEHGVQVFPGEAEPVHLGAMTLEGMPARPTQKMGDAPLEPNNEEHAQSSGGSKADQTKFKILLSMLSILHSRIQTSHPSRFLATSLPAAFGSYRRLPINITTTTAFLSLIGKLSGKQRPKLPPRASTDELAERPPEAATSAQPQLAPLPDPEPEYETTSPSALSASEADIIQRLLQAVVLEVLEEYILSLATQEPPSMSWAARLREIREPEKVVPRRQTERDKWGTNPTLQERDSLIHKFVDLSYDLGIDLREFSKQAPTPETVSAATTAANDASPPDYPTSPDQIPFPKIGAFLLLVARYFVPILSTPQTARDAQTDRHDPLHLTYELTGIGDIPNSPALLGLPTPVLDSLIAILYAVRLDDIPGPSSALLFQESLCSEGIMLFLTGLCSDNPDQYIRGSAHAAATVIFRRCSSETKLSLIKCILNESSNPALQAVAVGWLKDDIAKKGASSLHADVLTTDAELGDALCVPLGTDDLLVQLPFRLAVLNLLAIAPTEQGDRLIHSLTRLRSVFSDEDAQQHGISLIDLWSFDDALQRAKNASAKQDPAARPKWGGNAEWLRAA
jgi:hypothetical protein